MSEALPYIGAVVGYWFGGPTGAQWGFAIGGGLGALTADRPNIQGPRLEDLKIVGTDYGQAIPWVSGSPRLAPQYIWASPLREIANSKKQGKGGGSKVTSFTYECDVILLLSENITEGVARDWINNELVRNGLTVKDGVWAGITVYTGEIDQLPDPTYEAAMGAGNAPAYRGRTTIVIRSLQLGNGKQLPNIEHQLNTLGGLDLTGVSIYAPLTTLTELEDQISPPQNAFPDASGVFSDLVFQTNGVDLQWAYPNSGTTGFSYLAGGGDFDIANDYLTTDRYIAFDYDFFNMQIGSPVGGPSYANGNTRFWYFADGTYGHTLSLRDHDSVGSPGSSFDLVWSRTTWPEAEVVALNFPLSGRMAIVFPQGTLNEMRVYVDNALFLSVSSAVALAVGNRTWRIGAAGRIDMRGAIFATYRVTELFAGYGSDPVYAPRLGNSLKDTLDALLARAGYGSAEYSVAAALDEVELPGYATTTVTATRSHLDTLRPFGQYEASCSDRLYIFPRAVTPVGTIPWGDLGASESPYDPADAFPLRMGNETEVPAQIAVRYRNVHADWNLGTEFSDRQVSSLVSTQSVDMPFGLTPTQAKRVADTIVKDAIAGLGRAALRLAGRKYAKYEPGDVLTTTSPDGLSYRFRIQIKRDFVFMLEWEVVLDDAAALQSEGITFDGYVPNVDPVRVASTDWETINIPPLQDSDASAPGPYVAVTPARTSEGDDWPGAVYVRARLPEAFDQIFTTGDAAVMGSCTSTLGDFAGGSTVPDWTQVLEVRVRGELASASFYDFFTDRTINAAVVGAPGWWEPIRFLNATFTGSDGVFNLYDLSGIMRGQLGQELLMDSHEASDSFVLLNLSIRRMVNQTTDIGQEHQVKAVTLNTFLSDVTAEDFTDDGIALRPYSPVALEARAEVDGDLAVSWVRRSRLVARYTDEGTFAPLGETTEAYRVTVPDAVPPRSVDVTSPAWTYSAADIAADGFTSGDPITIVVRQLSEAVGEGFATTLETEAP